jgi:hypothetical protein
LRILFEKNAPVGARHFLASHEVHTVVERVAGAAEATQGTARRGQGTNLECQQIQDFRCGIGDKIQAF